MAEGVAGLEEMDCSKPQVVEKYRFAGNIASQAVDAVADKCVDGADVHMLCTLGDAAVDAQCKKTYKKNKQLEKGCAFPTCISINDVVCHYSPLTPGEAQLKAGDIVKIDAGAHIDGFIGVAAKTIVVPGAEGAAAGGGAGDRAGDVITAAYNALQLAVRMVKPGTKNTAVSAMFQQVAEAYGVNLCQGVLSHQMKQYVIDGNKVILLKEEQDQKAEEAEFQMYETYAIDVAMSTGEGKLSDAASRTTVYKRELESGYRLKMKASRTLLNVINRDHSTMPFSLRQMEDQRQARMGVVEMLEHGMLHEYPVLREKDGEVTAHFKVTMLVMPHGSLIVTPVAMPAGVATDKSLPEELAAELAKPAYEKKKKAKK